MLITGWHTQIGFRQCFTSIPQVLSSINRVHYFRPGPIWVWTKGVPHLGNRVPFGTHDKRSHNCCPTNQISAIQICCHNTTPMNDTEHQLNRLLPMLITIGVVEWKNRKIPLFSSVSPGLSCLGANTRMRTQASRPELHQKTHAAVSLCGWLWMCIDEGATQ